MRKWALPVPSQRKKRKTSSLKAWKCSPRLSSSSVCIVLDTAILVRGQGSAKGLARDLLIRIVESDHVLLISDGMLCELTRVLRYPRMLALYGISEKRVYDFVGFLREPARDSDPESVVGYTDSRCE